MKLEAAKEVLEVRGIGVFNNASLSDLYDPLAMLATLLRAHSDLDKAVDAAFAPRRRFTTEADRLALLFERYEALITAGQLISPAPRPTRRH